MAVTAAQRQKRYRHHHAGDHSLCDPMRDCRRGMGPRRDADATPQPVDHGFGSRGRELWDDMSGHVGPAHRMLLVEACRLVDRLDRLDRVLRGEDWLDDRDDRFGRVVIVVDQAVTEARQHVSALKAIVAQLEPRPKAAPVSPPARRGGGLADLTARIEARRGANSTG